MATRIGVYSVTSTLGHGTFGKVKLARNTDTGKEYAMKILDKADIKTHDLTASVRREISIMKALTHKNIVNLIEVLSSKHKLYIVMDLVRGGELFDIIDKHGGLSEIVARKYFQQLVDGVEYCHRQGVCHRDLKPENLLVDENGVLKITDFGVSSMKQNNSLLFTACGTPYYAAPEILSNTGEGYDGHKADVWSCGVILFLLLCGQLPWENEEDVAELYEEIKRAKFPYPSEISEGPRDLISNMMQREPTLRFDLNEVKSHSWFLEDYDGQGNNEVSRSMLDDPHSFKVQPKRNRSRMKLPVPLQFGRNRSKEEKIGGPNSEWRLMEVAKRVSDRASDQDGAAEHAPEQYRKSPSASDVSATSGRSSAHNRSREILEAVSDSSSGIPESVREFVARRDSTIRRDTPVDLDANGQRTRDFPKRAPKNVTADFRGKTMSDFLVAALPGKPQQKIKEIVEKLEDSDIECVDDIQTVADFVEDPEHFRKWLEDRCGVPAVTSMRLAKMFYG